MASSQLPTPLDPSLRKRERANLPPLTPIPDRIERPLDQQQQPLPTTNRSDPMLSSDPQRMSTQMAPLAPPPPPTEPHMAPASTLLGSGGPSSSAMGPMHGSSGALMVPTKAARSMMGFGPNPYHARGGEHSSNILLTSDDRALSRHVEATHVPDDNVLEEIRPLFNLVKDIFEHVTRSAESATQGALEHGPSHALGNGTHAFSSIDIPNLSLITERISCELACKKWGAMSVDAHEMTISVLQLLSHFTWEAKAVLTLAAFAMSYGEFWLLAQIYNYNHLAKSMAVLKQLPMVMDHRRSFKTVFDGISDCIRAMLRVTDCIIKFRELPPIYVAEDDPALKAGRTHIPIAVYWVVRSIVTAATQITALTSQAHEYMSPATEVWELQNRTQKLDAIYEQLMAILRQLLDRIDQRREEEEFRLLERIFFEMIHIDNMPVLTHIIARDDPEPIYDCNSKTKVPVHVLRNKNVLLLISGLDISADELSILEQIYNESKIHAYEVLWLPIILDPTVQWNESLRIQFEQLRGTMPWYSVTHPNKIPSVFHRFVQKHWNFRSQPILVVLDSRGKVLSPNAIHMMLIWGSIAFPFTTDKEKELWRMELWRLELLVDGIDQTIVDWIREDRYILMYGGDNTELIRGFTKEVRAVAQSVGIKIEMLYVGKSHSREVVRKICATIMAEKLSDCWQAPAMVWFFWKRIESMLYSKMELKRADDHSDIIIQEVKKLISYDKIPGGWALLSKGNEIVLLSHMSTMLMALQGYEKEPPYWKERVPADRPEMFPPVFKEITLGIHETDLPCSRFEFPSKVDPTGMLCPECDRPMEKHISFLCCHGRGV